MYSVFPEVPSTIRTVINHQLIGIKDIHYSVNWNCIKFQSNIYQQSKDKTIALKKQEKYVKIRLNFCNSANEGDQKTQHHY
jgi:hypothetical protein